MTALPNLVVVDASAVVALVASRGAVGDRVAQRIGSMLLYAPQILPAEVDSALRGLVAGRVLSAAQGDAAREQALSLPVELWPWHPLSARAWELRANLSSYDAGYVALAEHLAATLVTADARLARAPGLRCEVAVLA